MKKNMFFGAIVILLGFTINLSCKKELSCEACDTNAVPPESQNKPPTAIAGPDQVITLPTDSISLDGSASSDPDGTISEWLWTKISGPSSFNLANPGIQQTQVTNLAQGVYQFELKVTDAGGLFSKDTVQIIVSNPSPLNRPPIANAGSDQTIILPINRGTLDGRGSSDPDNNIVSYVWAKISGPYSYTIGNVNDVLANLTDVVQGVYQIELKVTDAGGLFSKDTMKITVINPTPACNDCKIVFVSDRDGNPEIYSCNSDGSNILRLTYDAGTDDEPAWSPDHSRIAFISNRTGNSELYIMNADGSNVIRKTFSGIYTNNPAWSPDGTKIIYSTKSNGSSDIWVINANSGSPSLLFEAPGYDGRPVWSPDGTKIALISDWAAYDFVYDIYTINADGTGFRALTGFIFDHVDYLNPSWSPNGTKLAMAISQTTGINQYNTQIGIMNYDGTGITVIRSGAAAWSRSSWSADGTKVAYTSLAGTRMDVSWVSANGSEWGTIVTNGWNADWQH